MSEWIVAGLHAPKRTRPPDAEKESPGAVEAATGAATQTVPGVTTPKYPKPQASVQSTAFAVGDEQDRLDGVAEHDGEHRAADIDVATSSVATSACSSGTSSPWSPSPAARTS